MYENRIRGRVVIEFTQGPDGEVRPRIEVDDWIRHWSNMKPEAMAIAQVPKAVIAARILADMCNPVGIDKALEFAEDALEKARLLKADIDSGKKPMAGADGEEQESSVH